MRNKNTPLIFLDWENSINTLNELKQNLKKIEKEYFSLQKKNKIKKNNLTFFLSLPQSFIYPAKEYLKGKDFKNLRKIKIGGREIKMIDSVEIKLKQIKNVGGEFILIGKNESFLQNKDQEIEQEIKKEEKRNEKVESKNSFTKEFLLERLSAAAKKVEESSLKKEIIKIEKLDIKKINKTEESLISALDTGLITVLFINREDAKEDLKTLTEITKKLIKNIHYNMFNRLIICYEKSNHPNLITAEDLEDCQEKTIAIRRTISNMFGIDNAKKVKIIYTGKMGESDKKNVLENAGIDGIFIENDRETPTKVAKIIYELNKN